MQTSEKGLSSFALRNLAMLLMLIDHTGATLFPDLLWLRYIGRLAFPIFAFLIVEGYYHTKNLNRYLLRLLALAIITDIPYHLMDNKIWAYQPFHNVIWTFLIGLATVWSIDNTRQKYSKPLTIGFTIVFLLLGCFLAESLHTDYSFRGVLTLVGFYFCHGQTLKHKAGQVALLLLVNLILSNIETVLYIGFENIPYYWNIYGMQLISPQRYAPLALLFIWQYNGRAGHQSKVSQAFNYLFYPVHMLILGLLALYIF
ncbi:TraX family protein [Streptococcus ovuberis]|uniref:TraX protein n=1 Tax=Streptococcus ovuberis TaxID=1936207 RepID=A0A7X6N2Y8_9STRE|nr:TraX family protein [Streptococcus ovuberis]NKZ21189.1 hypothetical protein [Streptococcus ovuberis]